MFKSMVEYKAFDQIDSTKRGCKGQKESIVEQAVRNCVNIKSRQTKARDNSLETIEKLIADNNLLKNKILIVPVPCHIYVEKNLTGLIANQLMSKYQRPVLLLNEVINEEPIISAASGNVINSLIYSTWEGSARGYDKSSLTDFRKFCLDSGCIDYAEGHANAFGFGVNNSKIKEFIDYCNTTLESFEFTPCYDVDFIFNADNFNGKDILERRDQVIRHVVQQAPECKATHEHEEYRANLARHDRCYVSFSILAHVVKHSTLPCHVKQEVHGSGAKNDAQRMYSCSSGNCVSNLSDLPRQRITRKSVASRGTPMMRQPIHVILLTA